MGDIPKLTAQTRPAVEFGHRYLAQPLIERARHTAGRIEDALSRGDIDAVRAASAELRQHADDQDRWTRELLDGAPQPPTGGSAGAKR